jgi:hypothetical protein
MEKRITICERCQPMLQRRGRLSIHLMNSIFQVTFDGQPLEDVYLPQKRRCFHCGSKTRNIWRFLPRAEARQAV